MTTHHVAGIRSDNALSLRKVRVHHQPGVVSAPCVTRC
jgi:hypothetical protein